MSAVVRRPRRRRIGRLLCQVIALVAALVAGLAVPAHPSGVEVVDRLLVAGYVAGIALAGGRARRWTWLVLAGIAGTFAAVAWATVAGVVAIVVAGLTSWRRRSLPAAGALVGALGAMATLRLADGGVTGVSFLLGAAAVGPFLWSGYRQARRGARRAVRLSLAGGALVVVAIGLTYALAVLSARATTDRGVEHLRDALAASRAGDVEAAEQQFDAALEALDSAASSLDAWWAMPARAVPVLGHNARAVAAAVDVARDLTGTARGVVAGAGSDDLGMQAGRFDPAAFEALRAPLGNLRVAIDRAAGGVDGLDSPWLLGPVADGLTEIRDEMTRAEDDVDLALQGVDAIPDLLGAGGERTYLVLFVTPVEARATGFVGNYAELVVTDGRFSLPRFGRIADLQLPPSGPTPVLDLPAEFLERYLRFGIRRTWRSVTVSPDFPRVAQLAAQLYAQSGGRPVDGVLTVDPTALAAFLRFTGPIVVPELAEPLTTDTAADFLLRGQYVDFPDVPERVDALESLGRTTFDRLTVGDLPSPQQLASVLGPPVAAGNLRLAVFDERPAAFLAEVGIDHPLPEPVGDAIAVTTTNVVGGKLDAFLQRTIEYDAVWDPATGAVTATLRVTMRNDSPSSGLPEYVIGDAIVDEDVPLGTNRSRVSIYSPWVLDDFTVDGASVPVEVTRERGHYVYGVFVELAPDGGQAVLELRLSGQLPDGGGYRLDVWNQVLARPDQFRTSIEVAGSQPLELSGLEANGRLTSADAVLDRPLRFEVHTTVAVG